MNIRIVAAVTAAAMISAVPVFAQDQFSVSAPTGWVQTGGPAGVLGLWVEQNPNDFKQSLNLVSEPYSGSLTDYVAENRAALASQEKGAKFGPEADSTTCGSHPAHFITWETTLLGHDLLFEQMISIWSGRGYVLTYTRQSGEPELNAARVALMTLCIRNQ
ncbi:MAG: hypothetical protein ACHQY2_02100 [Candidatus Eremiobacterales bacterium]|jgi:hypothetical protein